MNPQDFNEWMLYIHEQLHYPKEKMKSYEQSIRAEAVIQNNKRWAEPSGVISGAGSYPYTAVTKENK